MSGNRSEFEQGLAEMLLEDKENVQRVLESASEESIASTIRMGVEQGRQQVRRRKSRLAVHMTASAVIVLVLLTACIRVSPAFAELVREIPGLTGVVELIKGDTTLTSAINHEFIQPVNKSVSKNGYTLTVDGVMADQQRIVIFYTADGQGVSEDMDITDYKVTDGYGEPLEALIGSSYYAIGHTELEKDDATSIHDMMDIMLGEGVPVPGVIRFSLKLGGEWHEVDIPVDHSRFEELREEITLNKEFEVGGQRFLIEKALVTPLQASVTIRREPDARIRANSFIKLALVDEKGRRWETKGGFGMLDDGTTTLTFQSNYFEKPEHLRLVADGLLLSLKDQKFVINTETGDTLETPDDRIRLTNVQSSSSAIELSIEATRLNELEQFYGYWLFDHKAVFHDASGTEYTLLDHDGTQSTSRGDADGSGFMYEAYYSIPNKPYKQPLTFELYQYPGYVEEPVNVVIK
ncbi:protein of unknown function [Paenibacillus catalpae]|uniref:DUF4179 domain-containing protein n=1 Tax=Paenibacillus catalpae TaxID=1045775 RepID=A0A1I2I5W5_9BACL|nr:DUF4179 domain-containing protein [Paenibacillus catalpae]SFF35891.1 protein of unknown function [Paenibacillus catalpae]